MTSTLNSVSFILALSALVASTVVLGVLQPKRDIRRRLGPAYFSTDTTFGYRPAALYAMLERYAGDDYKAHKLFIALDLLYPLVYSVALAVMLGHLFPRTRYVTLLPFAAALCDLLENLSMLLILNLREGNAAGRSDLLANFSSAMTTVKLLLLCATLLVVLFGLLSSLS